MVNNGAGAITISDGERLVIELNTTVVNSYTITHYFGGANSPTTAATNSALIPPLNSDRRPLQYLAQEYDQANFWFDEDNEDEDTGNENETEDTGNLISKIKTLFSTPAEKDGNTPAVVINKNVIDKKENSISGNAVSDSTSSGDTITIKKTTYYALLLYIPFLIELAMLIGLLVFDSYKRREENKDKKPQNKPNKRLLKKDTKSFTSKIKEIKKLIRR